jgi:hypothetical protein
MSAKTTRNPAVTILHLACLLLAGCGAQDGDKPFASPPPVAPTPAVAPASVAGATSAAVAQLAAPAPALPPAPLYVCVVQSAGGQERKVIELPPRVEALCRKAPEMGPCRYEREGCRRGGGSVVTADGTEITRQTEAEYDRRVMRIRMKSN